MEYNFTEKEEETFVNHFYQVFFASMYSELNKRDCKSITRELAKKQRELEKKQSDRELKFANSLIGRMLMTVGVKSPYRKHYYEDYDLMLLVMRYLNKDRLYIRDFATLDIKDFYVKFIKERFDKLDEIKEKIYSLPMSATEEQNELFKQEGELYKKLIPTEEDMEKNGYEL
ncbi:MAG: hypothetical protein J6Q13_00975 [Clostridia bacterium]|nr:hypothetical protein [Clostridia bacterium]